jgi:hypothetical protein
VDEAMFELAKRARWQDVLDLLESGQPPIYLQLLVVNIAFLLYFVGRGLMIKPEDLKKRPKPRYGLEFVIIASNVAILTQHSWLYLFNNAALQNYMRALMRL